MSIFFVCMSAFPPTETNAILDQARQSRHAILDHFWISDVTSPDRYDIETANALGFDVQCAFLIQWNKESGSELIPSLPKALYDEFGKNNLLVFDVDRELIR